MFNLRAVWAVPLILSFGCASAGSRNASDGVTRANRDDGRARATAPTFPVPVTPPAAGDVHTMALPTAAPGDFSPVPKPKAGELTLYFLDVGQGDATLIVCPNGNRILVDVGAKGGSGPDEVRQLVRSLLASGSPKLSRLVISHADGDHYNLVAHVLGGASPVAIERVLVAGAPQEFDKGEPSGFKELFIDWLADGTAEAYTSDYFDPMHIPSTDFPCGEKVYFWVIAAEVPEQTDRSNFVVNTRSVVLMISYLNFDAILTGDATFTTEDAILSRYPKEWLSAEVLKLGHHGSSATSSGSKWLAAVNADVAISSSAYAVDGNWFGHPNRKVTEVADNYTGNTNSHEFYDCAGKNNCKMKSTTEAIYGTASSGTIVIATDGESYSLTCTRADGC